MGLNVSDGVLAALAAAAGAAILKAWEFFFPSKKESAETKVLSSTDDRDREKFWVEQLTAIEKRYIFLQKEAELYRKQIKMLIESLDTSERNYKIAQTDITYLKLELEAYKS